MKELAGEFCTFIDQSPSPFHAVSTVVSHLKAAGYVGLLESDVWGADAIIPGGKYFYTRNGSSVMAFAVGGKVDLAAEQPPAFKVVGAHTDSPCFKVKPVSSKAAHGYTQMGVECYGGGLWYTWFDRDLTVAGRVFVQKDDDTVECSLVHLKKPVCRIPSLAIHLNRTVGTDGFKVNKERHTVPIIATEVKKALIPEQDGSSSEAKHPPALLAALAEELGCKPEAILDLELSLADTQPAAIGGLNDEFVFSPRLDNLASCFTSLKALLGQTQGEQESDDGICTLAFFDHEEVGSSSAHGAGGPMLKELIHRLVGDKHYEACVRRSFLLSADMAHAIHPNYPDKHETAHRPAIHRGAVIKTNSNQRYSTTGVTGLVMRQLAALGTRDGTGIPVQEFVVPNDVPCGSTIGPIISSGVGIRTVDVGQPQLAMHSCREMCGVDDVTHATNLFSNFFRLFAVVDSSLMNVAEVR